MNKLFATALSKMESRPEMVEPMAKPENRLLTTGRRRIQHWTSFSFDTKCEK